MSVTHTCFAAAQHDSAVTHSASSINLLHCIIAPRWVSLYPDYFLKLHNSLLPGISFASIFFKDHVFVSIFYREIT